MNKEQIYVVIDDEQKRLRAIQILTDAKEEILSGSILNEKFHGKATLGIYRDRWQDINTNFKTEITLDQLEQLLNPNFVVKEVHLTIDELRKQAESLGFELVEKKREIKKGDFGKFWTDKNCYFVGFLKDIYKIHETNKCVFQLADYGTFCYFEYLTDEEKQAITENW